MHLPAFSNAKGDTNAQYLFFRLLFDVANVVTWTYYIILLLRASNNSVAVVFLNAGGYNTGIILGSFLASFFLSKLGYARSFRLSNFLLVICTILTLATLPNILTFHILLAVLRGIAKAFYFVPSNMYNLKEVRGAKRSSFLNLTISIDYIIGIALPVVVGGSIVAYGYTWIFVVGIMLYLVGSLYRWGGNKIPHDVLNFAQLRPLMRRRGFKRWSISVVFMEFFNELQVDALSIIPFLFLGNEFSVGLLLSGLGFVAAIMTFLHRKDKFKRKLNMGYFGASVIGISNLLFGIIWTLPSMILRGTAVTVGGAFNDPATQEYSYRNKELVLGTYMGEATVEVDLYLEVLYYIARLSAAFVVGIAVMSLQVNESSVLQFIVIITSFNAVVILLLNGWVSNILSRGSFRPLPAMSAVVPLAGSSI